MKILTAVLVLLLVCTASTSGQRQKLHYEPETVTLTGRVIHRTFYGPPNYGEYPKSDTREKQVILILDSAVDVIANGNDAFDHTELKVRDVTLVLHRATGNLSGKRVVVEGTLFHAHTGHHHTRVLMDVQTITLAK